MARQEGEPGRRRLPRFVSGVSRSILEIVALYAIASLVDGSLAGASRPIGWAIVAAVVAVLLLYRWFPRRYESPSRRIRVGEGSTATAGVATPAFQRSGETSGFAEYVDARTELVNLIASVEARLSTAPEPSARLDVVSDSAWHDWQLSAAQNTKLLTQAAEQVAHACDLIAQACELVAERVESDRRERQTLAGEMMMAAQPAARPTSTPRLKNTRPIRPPAEMIASSPGAPVF